MKLTTHLHVMPRFRRFGAVHPHFPPTPVSLYGVVLDYERGKFTV